MHDCACGVQHAGDRRAKVSREATRPRLRLPSTNCANTYKSASFRCFSSNARFSAARRFFRDISRFGTSGSSTTSHNSNSTAAITTLDQLQEAMCSATTNLDIPLRSLFSSSAEREVFSLVCSSNCFCNSSISPSNS